MFTIARITKKINDWHCTPGHDVYFVVSQLAGGGGGGSGRFCAKKQPKNMAK